ncbi:hypothetical protein C2845_PM01G33200 [Panicum miliaceum]|uniref:Uncharacterized protein n=1 Tax=Panicum miliaceum TaxID=4540 RepID=A0A3L6TRT3_PANMI|nr:hypothetical protein C2845_PM01G33200 [Panicum miliaceum]
MATARASAAPFLLNTPRHPPLRRRRGVVLGRRPRALALRAAVRGPAPRHQRARCVQECREEQERGGHELGRRGEGSGDERESESEQEQEQERSRRPYVFDRRSFRRVVRSEQGSVRALWPFHEASKLLRGIRDYRDAVLEANPRSFVVPSHTDAHCIGYVAQVFQHADGSAQFFGAWTVLLGSASTSSTTSAASSPRTRSPPSQATSPSRTRAPTASSSPPTPASRDPPPPPLPRLHPPLRRAHPPHPPARALRRLLAGHRHLPLALSLHAVALARNLVAFPHTSPMRSSRSMPIARRVFKEMPCTPDVMPYNVLVLLMLYPLAISVVAQ